MTRIVAGSARGRPLATPPGDRTRPTSDRAREGMFNSLLSLLDLAGARVLDLYAGTGAVGLEALSRGAAYALLVDSDPAAVRVLRANVATLALPGAEVRPVLVERLLARPAGTPFELVFLDPPYADPVDEVLSVITQGDWIAPGGVCVVERSRRETPLTWPNGLEALIDRSYGDTTLWYGRAL